MTIDIQPEVAALDCMIVDIWRVNDHWALVIRIDAVNEIVWHAPRLLPWMKRGPAKILLAGPLEIGHQRDWRTVLTEGEG